MSEGIKVIKDGISFNNLKKILTLVLWCAYFYLMVMVARDLYQTFKDFHYHLANMVLVALAMLIKKDFRIKWVSFIPACAFGLGGINYLWDSRMNFGREYKLVLFSKYCLIAALIVWCISLLMSEKPNEYKWKKSIGGGLLLTFSILASIVKYDFAYYFIVPLLLVLTIGEIDRERIKEQMNLIAIALYANFAIPMTYSLAVRPQRSNVGRYEGIFFFPVVVGILSSMGIFASLHFFMETYKRKSKLSASSFSRKIVLLSIMMVYPCVMLILSGNRSAFLGIFIIVVSFSIFGITRLSRKVQILAIVLAAIIIIGSFGGLLWMSKNFDSQKFVESKNIDTRSILYYFVEHLPSIREYNSTGVFQPRTIWASLDATSSDRLGIWVTGLKKVTLLGKNDTLIILPTGEDAGHVHSTYIFWLMYYGAIVGGIGIIWMVYSFVNEIVRFFVKREGELIPVLFTMFAFGIFGVEREMFEELLPTLMILFGYRFFYLPEVGSKMRGE